MVYEFFDKMSASLTDKSTEVGSVNNEINKMNCQPKNYLNQLLKKNLKRFKDNIWGADLADIQLISKFNKGTRFLSCVIDIFIKYAWVVPLNDRKGITIVNAFQKILDNSTEKPIKIWVDKGSEFYYSSF